jgi:hypothetical protein
MMDLESHPHAPPLAAASAGMAASRDGVAADGSGVKAEGGELGPGSQMPGENMPTSPRVRVSRFAHDTLQGYQRLMFATS